MIDFDLILEKIGSFKKFQGVALLAMTYCGLPCGISVMTAIFVAYEPKFRCYMGAIDEEASNCNVTQEQVLDITTPKNEYGDPVDSCVRYGYNISDCGSCQDLSCVNTSKRLIPCESYYFDDSVLGSTIVTEFELVCDRWKLNIVDDTVYMSGELIGSLLCGYVSDRFGRKRMGLVAISFLLPVMLWTSLCQSYGVYCALRFLQAVLAIWIYINTIVYILEIVSIERRTMVGMITQMGYIIGYMNLSWISYVFQDWRKIQLAALALSIPALPIFFALPESPRWLLSKGTKDETGKRIVEKIAKFNGKHDITQSDWDEAQFELKETNDKLYTNIDLFRYPEMRLLTIKLGFVWAAVAMVYNGLFLNTASLSGSIFLNNVYAGIFEISSNTVVILILDKIGRRTYMCFAQIIAGLCLLASVAITIYTSPEDEGLQIFGIVLNVLGRALMGSSFAIAYSYTSELYPTVMRTNGVGTASVFGGIGSILCPTIVALQGISVWLPTVIFGICAMLSGIVCLSIRDTTGEKLMETVEEAEQFHSRKNKRKSKRSPTDDIVFVNEAATFPEPEQSATKF